ncbi:MAG TPA: hypothetical protein VHB72_04840 [Candidatus Saccharimonadales bacterium]|nr:hypothetical protein [Candidatus Saccharimonadales bacterium]
MPEHAAWFSAQPEVIPEDELSIEGFQSRWGNALGFSGELFERLWNRAAQFYPETSGHDFSHAAETAWRANLIVDFSEANGTTMNRKLVTGMSFFHDACSHSDPRRAGFATKEARAGFVFFKNAPLLGFTYPEAIRGQRGIETTNPYVRPSRNEDVALNLADLYNVGANYERVMVPRTEEFAEEAAERYGDKFDFARFTADSIRLVLNLTSLDRLSGPFQIPEWQALVDTNLRSWAANAAEAAGTSFQNYVRGLGGVAAARLL